jgi:divalent metal cation (Fe/Co/Zn/Cd) transporter
VDSVQALAHGHNAVKRAAAARRGQRLQLLTIGWNSAECLVALAPGFLAGSIALAALALGVMLLLARLKRRVASRLGSGALEAEARQTQICAWRSAILLAGLGLNAWRGWWWADPVAALAMPPFIAREGWEALRGRTYCAA